jgi:chromate transporter
MIKLAVSFMLIGLGAYGGGMVTIPLIQHELVQNRQWLKFDEMGQILAIAQITPGPIAINAATFTGYRLSGVPGALLATAAVILPSLLILSVLTPWLEKFRRADGKVGKIRDGLQLGVLSLILFAIGSFGMGAIKSRTDMALAVMAFLGLIISERKLHPVMIILLCGMIGTFIF